jgi:hypothetical protein
MDWGTNQEGHQGVESGAEWGMVDMGDLVNVLPPQLEAMIVADMEELGVDPALVYAFQHTGFLVTDATMDGYTDQELQVWQAAVDRYHRLQGLAQDSR